MQRFSFVLPEIDNLGPEILKNIQSSWVSDFAGQALHEVRLDAAYKDASQSVRGARWALAVKAREAAGELAWEGSGKGTLTARLKHLRLDPASFGGEGKAASEAGKGAKPAASTAQRLEELPALDVVAEEFDLGARRFGRLELQASNEAGVWRVARLRTAGEGGTLEADLDEGRLHARQHALDLAQIDVADDAAAGFALDVQFLHHVVFEHGHPRFLRRDVDEDLLGQPDAVTRGQGDRLGGGMVFERTHVSSPAG